MKKKINKEQITRFFIMFLLILFKYIEVWSYLFTKEFFKSKFIVGVAIVMIIIIIAKIKIPKNKFLKILKSALICVGITLLTKSVDYIVFFVLSILYFQIKDGDKKFIKHYLLSTFILFVVTIILSLLGILPSFTITRIVNNEIVTRYNLGFLGANSLFMFFYPIVISFLYLKFNSHKSKKILYSIVIFLITFIFYNYTNCRTGMLCIFLIIIVYLNSSKLNYKVIRFLLKYYYIIFFIISIIFALNFNAYDDILNRLSSGRFYYWNYYIQNVGYSFFGTSPIKGIPIDNIYISSLYYYGLISTILCFIVSLLPYKNKTIKNEYYFIVLAFSTYGFFENNVAYVYNFLTFFQLYYYINSKKK